MKVLIVNTVLLNGGDAAILRALVGQIRRVFGEDVEVEVGAMQPSLTRRYYPDLSLHPTPSVSLQGERLERPSLVRRLLRFPLWYLRVPRLYLAAALLGAGRERAARALTRRREWAALRPYAEADLVVSTGGTYLVENYWLGPLVLNLRVAHLVRRPLALYTQSLGPFRAARHRRALRPTLRDALLVLLRDEASLDAVRDVCGPLEQAHVTADAAFALADPAVLRAAGERRGRAEGRRMRVAVSVREWPYFKTVPTPEGQARYRRAVAAAVTRLVEAHGADVTFLSTCQGVPEYRYDDADEAERVVAELPAAVRDRVRIDRDFHPPEALHERLGACDLVIATRMHMAILALTVGVPVLPIAYEFKTTALFERLGMARWVHDIETVSAEGLPEAVDAFLGELDALRPGLFEAVERERRRAIEAADLLGAAYRRRGTRDGR